MALLDLEDMSPSRLSLLTLGLGMMGHRTLNEALQGGSQGLLNGLQIGQQQQLHKHAAKMQEQQMAMAQAKFQREQDQLEALQNINISSPDAVNALMRSGNVDEAVKLYKAFNPASGVDPYFQAVPTSNGYVSFNARTGEYKPMGDLRQPASDPVLQRQIAAAKDEPQIQNYKMSNGAEVPMRKVDALNLVQGHVGNYGNGMPRRMAVNPQQQGDIGQDIPIEQAPQAIKQLRAAGDNRTADMYQAAYDDYMAKNGQGSNPVSTAAPLDIGQSTEQEAKQKELGKAQADATSGLQNKMALYSDILAETQRAIDALSPKQDKLSGKVVGFGMETGGMLPGVRQFWKDKIVNDPKIRDIETAAKAEQLQAAQQFLKGQGQVSDAERKLIAETVGVDPYQYSSAQNYERLTRRKRNLEAAIQAEQQRAAGNFTPVKPSDNVDDLVKHYLGQ